MMTSTPSRSKGKTHAPIDWHLRAIQNVPFQAQLGALKLPMAIVPEQKDMVPVEYVVNIQFLVSGTTEGPPWTGYYATLHGARLAITNVFGVWCEICRCGSGFEAHRLARMELLLLDAPVTGIDYTQLRTTGEPLTHAPSRATTPVDPTMEVTTTTAGPWGPTQTPKEEPRKATGWVMPPLDEDEDPDNDYPIQSSATNRPPCQPGQPGGTGEDPMALAAMQSTGYLHLKGNPPDHFNSDRSCTRHFLTQFRQFMLMNDGATIAQNDIKKCTYFLSLLKGPQVEGWSEAKYNWLNTIKQDPRMLMGCTPWAILMREFLDAFTDFAESKKAQNTMRHLKMKEGKIDEYVTAFERLTHCAGVDLDDPSNLQTFAQGLPGPLVKTVIQQDDPQNYVQWHKAAQRHQRSYLKIQSYKGTYGNAQPLNQGGQPPHNVPFGNFYWHRPNNSQGGQENHQQPACQRLPPCNDDAMDTSAAMQKATTDKEKEEYRKTGQCFECGKQGHLVQVCPTKRN